MDNVNELKIELERVLVTQTTTYWLKKLGDAGVPSGPLNTVMEAVQNPQIVARNMIVDILNPGSSKPSLQIAGNPIKISGYLDPQVRGPAPDLNEHHYQIKEKF